jgi:hypothetical protein
MISGLQAAVSNSEKHRKLMLMNSDLENSLKEKTAYCGSVKEGITKQ